MTERLIGLVLHTDRATVESQAAEISALLAASGVKVVELTDVAEVDHPLAAAELLLVLGGDGTILKAAELSRNLDLPLLGLNFGRVGFLAEAESGDVSTVAEAIVNRRWTSETRIILDVTVYRAGQVVYESFALNELAIEKLDRQLMTELRISVDGAALMAWYGDGVVVSTPTGSTGYAFSAGGPVIWPTANVILTVPISAHALFAKPIVVSPDSTVSVEVLSAGAAATLDGRRRTELQLDDVVSVHKSGKSLEFARIHDTTFTERIVTKFRLPTAGWREQRP